MTTSFYTRLKLERAELFVGAWVLAMIALPVARWVVGDDAIRWGVVVTTVFQFGAVVVALAGAWKISRTVKALAFVAAAAYLAEFLGSKTGFPFGEYHYTSLLQPQLAGVPLLIPLAWFMMLPPAWAVAQVIVGDRSRGLFALVSALAFTAWDLFLDPQMVAWGLWVWQDSTGGYFGIPLQNYAGWLLISFLITFLLGPSRLPLKPLLVIYGIVWVFQTIGQAFFWGLPGPALGGFAGMGVMLLWVWWRWRGQTR